VKSERVYWLLYFRRFDSPSRVMRIDWYCLQTHRHCGTSDDSYCEANKVRDERRNRPTLLHSCAVVPQLCELLQLLRTAEKNIFDDLSLVNVSTLNRSQQELLLLLEFHWRKGSRGTAFCDKGHGDFKTVDVAYGTT
jgi:hypothetical protein